MRSYDKNFKHNFYQNYFTAIKPNEILCMGLPMFLAAAPNHIIYYNKVCQLRKEQTCGV